MNITIVSPGSFIHQQALMQYADGGGVFICGPTNENTVLTMNTMAYADGDGAFVTWMYY